MSHRSWQSLLRRCHDILKVLKEVIVLPRIASKNHEAELQTDPGQAPKEGRLQDHCPHRYTRATTTERLKSSKPAKTKVLFLLKCHGLAGLLVLLLW